MTEASPTSDQRHLIQLVFNKFHADGIWPLVDDLQLDLDRSDDELDVAAVGRSVSPSLLKIDTSYQGRVWLTIRGIQGCDGGEDQLRDLLQLVREGVERYLAVGLNAPLSSKDLKVTLGWDDLRLARVHLLLQSLPGFGGGQSNDTSWTRFVSRDIRIFKGVETVTELVERADVQGSPRPEQSERRTSSPESREAVFISCAERFKDELGYPLRDLLEANGVRAVIVTDLPRRGTAWTAEEKVNEYLASSDAMIVLATPDIRATETGEFFTRPNIADEIGRARTMDHLGHRICVLKESSVRLPSNIDPAYESLNIDNPVPAFSAALAQLREWGFRIPETPATASFPKPSAALSDAVSLVEGLVVEEPGRTRTRMTDWLRDHPGQRQELVDQVVVLLRTAPRWEDRAVAGHALEAIDSVDPTLVSTGLISELSHLPDSSIRSSLAVLLFGRAVSSPGQVPVDVLARLALPNPADDAVAAWYVLTPAWNCLKQLLLTRSEAWPIVEAMAAYPDRGIREAAASVILGVARHRPAVVNEVLVSLLESDLDRTTSELAAEARALLAAVSPEERQRPYSPFSAF